MMDKDRSQREEIFDGLQCRISREKAILQRRLTQDEPKKKRAPSLRSRRSSRTGRLYDVFQALGEDE